MKSVRSITIATCLVSVVSLVTIVSSCRPRKAPESDLAGQGSGTREKRSFRIKKIGDPNKFSVRFFHDDSVSDGQKVYMRWDVVSRTSADGATDCSSLREESGALDYNMLRENPNRRSDRQRYGGVNLEIDTRRFDKQCPDASTSSYKVLPECQGRNIWSGPMQFEACVYSDAAMTKLVRRGWGMPRMQPDMSVAEQSQGSVQQGMRLVSEEEIPDIDEVVNYGRLCAQKLGPLPPFKCTDGEIIPIKVDGQEVPFGQHQRNMKCDHPVYLGLGDDGQCVPYARLGRLDTGNPDVDTVFICRRYKLADRFGSDVRPRPAETPLHEDVAIVSHNRKTGETCWYQALSGFQPNQRSLPTNRVPPPSEATLPAEVVARNEANKAELDAALSGVSESERALKTFEFQSNPEKQIALSAEEFWIKPNGVRNFACVRCHDSDPFMLSPYVGQVKMQLPDGTKDLLLPCNPAAPGQAPDSKCSKRDGRGRYSMISQIQNPPRWPQANHIAPRARDAQLCVSCHRIGSINTCASWARDSVGVQGTLGRASENARSDRNKAFPHSHWMPLGVAPGEANFDESVNGHTEIEKWNEAFKVAADATLECCRLNASTTEADRATFNRRCTSTPITTPPPGSNRTETTLKIARAITIPDGVESGVTVPLVAAANPVPTGHVVRSLRVNAKVTHPYIGHVQMWLVRDSSRSVKLYDGNLAEIPADANLDIQLASGLEGSALNEFRNAVGDARWSVRIVDAETHEKGTLDSFELILTTVEP